MSQLLVDDIVNKEGTSSPGFSKGVIVTGVCTATTIKGALTGNVTGNVSGTAGGLSGTPDITVNNIVGVAATFTGALTYEDVTNVDSVGIVTARSGVVVSGGELKVGAGVTIGSAGVSTFSGTSDVHLHDNVKLLVGDSSDLQIYNDGTNNYIKHTTTGAVYVETTTNLNLRVNSNENAIVATANEDVSLYYNASKKFETTSSGTITVGISTADGFSVGDNEYITAGIGSDLSIYHDGTHNYVESQVGRLHLIGVGRVQLQNDSGVNHLVGYSNANTDLYYSTGVKISTQSTGVKVTGITSTSGLTLAKGLIQEKGKFESGGSPSGTFNHDVNDDGMIYRTSANMTGTFIFNLRGDGSTTFNSLMHIGQSAVFTAYTGSNNTSYYLTDFQIDGSSITEKWNGGSAPTAGTGSGTDVYTFNILKTADATFTVFATFSNFA